MNCAMAGQPPGSSSPLNSRKSSRSRTGNSGLARLADSVVESEAFLLDVSNYYVIFAIAIRARARQGLAKSPALALIEPDSLANRGLIVITFSDDAVFRPAHTARWLTAVMPGTAGVWVIADTKDSGNAV